MRASPFSIGPTRMLSSGIVVPAASEPVPDYEYGPELTTNGDFSSGTTGWTAMRSTLSVEGGRLVVTDTQADYPGAYQQISVTPGSIYEVAIEDLDRGDSTSWAQLEIRHGAASNGPVYFEVQSTPRNVLTTVVATASTMRILLVAETGSIGDKFSFGPASVREILNMEAPLAPVPTSQPAASSMTKPPLREWVPFDSFGTEIMRITEGGPIHQYSTRAAFNADGTLVLLSGSGYPYAVHNTSDGTLFRGSIAGAQVGYHQAVFFDPIDPEIIWCDGASSSSICKYNVTTNAVVQTYSIPGGYSSVLAGRGEGGISDDGRFIVLLGDKSDGNVYVLIFDALAGEVVDTLTLTGWSYGASGIDNAYISPSGAYFLLGAHKSGDTGVKVYDRATMTLLYTYPNTAHKDVGYRSDGDECMFLQGQGKAYMTVRLADGDERVEMRGGLTTYSQHSSLRNIHRPGWAYVSHFYNSGETSRVLYREIIAIRLDGRQTIERWGQGMFPASTGYDLEPHACVSPDGSMIVMASGWGTTDGEAYLIRRAS